MKKFTRVVLLSTAIVFPVKFGFSAPKETSEGARKRKNQFEQVEKILSRIQDGQNAPEPPLPYPDPANLIKVAALTMSSLEPGLRSSAMEAPEKLVADQRLPAVNGNVPSVPDSAAAKPEAQVTTSASTPESISSMVSDEKTPGNLPESSHKATIPIQVLSLEMETGPATSDPIMSTTALTIRNSGVSPEKAAPMPVPSGMLSLNPEPAATPSGSPGETKNQLQLPFPSTGVTLVAFNKTPGTAAVALPRISEPVIQDLPAEVQPMILVSVPTSFLPTPHAAFHEVGPGSASTSQDQLQFPFTLSKPAVFESATVSSGESRSFAQDLLPPFQLTPSVTTPESPLVASKSEPQKMRVRLTFYSGKDDQWGSRVAWEKVNRAKRGRTAAADPSLIPYGTWIQVPGFGKLRIEDTGTAVKSRKASGGKHPVIDVYVGNEKEAERLAGSTPDYVEITLL